MKAMILICVLCLILVGFINCSPKIVPVTDINLDSFMGRWYLLYISYYLISNKYYITRFQMYSSLIPVNTYEKDLVCIGLTLYTTIISLLY